MFLYCVLLKPQCDREHHEEMMRYCRHATVRRCPLRHVPKTKRTSEDFSPSSTNKSSKKHFLDLPTSQGAEIILLHLDKCCIDDVRLESAWTFSSNDDRAPSWAMRAQRWHMNSSIWLMSLLKMIKGGMFSGRNHMIGQTEGRYEDRGTDWSTNSIQ